MTSTPPTDQQLDEIETRAAHLHEYALLDDEPMQAGADQLTGKDVPLLPADSERHRLALSDALGLGTGAPWDAIRERAAELAGQVVAGGREAEAEQATEMQPETPLEKRLRYSERRNDELRTECLRRGRNVLEQSEKNRVLERQIDSIREQLGAEILRAGEAEAELRRLATEAPGPETQGGPRFVRVCTACPECDHTVDENGACENGCRPPAVVAEPGKENGHG